ncbi:hypothetical protein SRHO_G00132020 [Serrasalmus rhombeus]
MKPHNPRGRGGRRESQAPFHGYRLLSCSKATSLCLMYDPGGPAGKQEALYRREAVEVTVEDSEAMAEEKVEEITNSSFRQKTWMPS